MGPRPALPNEVAAYNDYQRQRLLVKPGMTCYWQTRRNRDSITFDEWVDLDLWRDELANTVQTILTLTSCRLGAFGFQVRKVFTLGDALRQKPIL